MEDKWIDDLKNGKIISERELRQMCEKVKEILSEESNVQPVSAPVNICGDIHGQFFDLLELFRTGGEIPDQKYIFLGDYVDRGYNSAETIEYLLCLKIKYPGMITILRGNHESRQISGAYGFYEEINKKYGNLNAWKYINEVFDFLPISAILEGKIFCVHGGLSPMISSIDQIRLINRNVEIPHEGAFSDLMWSDPEDIDTWIMSQRGAGWLFGWKVVNEFNHLNGLDLIARSHQITNEGFKYYFPNRNLVLVWSAPNYCYRCGNKASIMKVNSNLETEFKIFTEVPESSQSLELRKVVPYFL